MQYQIINSDSLEYLRSLQDNVFDSIVTDPPYGLSFMGKKWDYDVPSVEIWRECLRVLKPGGHLLAFAGTRTQHRMAVNIEDAGFEIRDMIAWVYGSGFPKSLDVSKAIDRASGNRNRDRQLEFTAWMRSTGITSAQINAATDSNMGGHYLTDASQPAIATADMLDKLRPLLPEVPEHIERLVAERTGIEWTDYAEREVVGSASVPIGHAFAGGTYGGDSSSRVVDLTAPATPDAERWQGWGTALKPALEPITVARKPLIGTVAENVLAHGTGAINVDGCRVPTAADDDIHAKNPNTKGGFGHAGASVYGGSAGAPVYDPSAGRWPANLIHDGSEEVTGLFGTASRFFYCAKANKSDREEGNNHPTVKPTTLMRYLCRLITPPRGTILDPFMGSGSTGKAAKIEGFNFVGVEKEKEYCEIAERRIKGV